jgi:DNA repair exonuclease SbcCD ATPase subunit
MRVLRVRLRNIYQHRDLDVAISGSRIALTGENGGGKSNFLLAIGECLHGEFHQNKDRVVTWGEASGEMFVEFALHDNRRIEVLRRFPSGSAEMRLVSPGGEVETITGAAKVNERILQELKTDKGVLQSIVFVGQKGIEDVLFARDAEKARLAQKFFGLQDANTLEKAITKALGETVTDSYADSLPALMESRASISAEIDSIERQLSGMPDMSAIEAEITALDGQIRTASATNLAISTLQTLLADDAKMRARHTESSAVYKTEWERFNAIDIGFAKQRFDSQSRAIQIKTRIQGLAARIASNSSSVAALGARPFTDAQVLEQRDVSTSLFASLKSLESDLASKQKLLDSIGTSPTCPTCGHPVDISGRAPLEAAIRQLNDEILAKKSEHASASSKCSTMESACSRWDASSVSLRHSLEVDGRDLHSAEYELSQIVEEDRQNPDPDVWLKKIREHESLSAELIRQHTSIQSIQNEINAIGTRIQAVQSQAVVNGVIAQPVDVAALQDQVSEKRARLMEVHSTTTHLASRRYARDQIDQQIKKARAAQLNNAASDEVRRVLTTVRAAFHPDGAPKMLVDRGTKNLEGRINHYLSILRAKFRITARDGLSFMCHFDTGTAYDTELSVGQKVALSWAFRLAACETFGSSVGLMTMDEPTATLDKNTNEAFLEIMDAMNELAEKFSMQFFVATHSDTLAKACDQTIKL